jgi:hypothetical protein
MGFNKISKKKSRLNRLKYRRSINKTKGGRRETFYVNDVSTPTGLMTIPAKDQSQFFRKIPAGIKQEKPGILERLHLKSPAPQGVKVVVTEPHEGLEKWLLTHADQYPCNTMDRTNCDKSKCYLDSDGVPRSGDLNSRLCFKKGTPLCNLMKDDKSCEGNKTFNCWWDPGDKKCRFK